MLKVVNHVNKLIENSDDPWEINSKESEQKKTSSSIKKIVLSGHIFSPSLFWSVAKSIVNAKIIPFLPNTIKDILLFPLCNHKCIESRFFAKTSYELLRMKLDLFVSKLCIYTIPKNLRPEYLEVFDRGIVSLDLGSLSDFDDVLLKCFDYKHLKFKNNYSVFYEYSQKDSDLITKLINERVDDLYHLYFLAFTGYYCRKGKLLYNLGITIEDNINCEMHQDTWSGLAKGFIYLTDVSESTSPFEYLEKSHKDSELRSSIVNSSVLSGASKANRSIRVKGKDLDYCLSKFKLRTCTGNSGTVILANTAGYHRKGLHNSDKPRIMLTFGYQRRGILSKLFINLYAILRTHLKLI